MTARVDIAKRVHDHTWKLDPIVRTLLDTDFYKLLMGSLIHRLHPDVAVTFSLVNRTKSVLLCDEVDEGELREQLDHARSLKFEKNELIWLAGNTFYGRQQIFDPDYLAWLADFQLPDYELTRHDGQYELRFSGPWRDVTMWEVPALAIITELRSRAAVRKMSRFELDVLYARAKSRLWDKIERLRALAGEGPLKVGDFGTRRRHSYLWQLWCVEALKEGVGECLTGTSNVKMAMDLGLEAIGTNAHELPMVYAALARDDAELRQAPYKVLADWASIYDGNLKVVLPDAYGSTNFFRNAPGWVASWKGVRPDSKPPIDGADEILRYWRRHGQDPMDKTIILSDGMDIGSIETAVRHLRGRTNVLIGWGTNLTNDFRGCAPSGIDGRLKAISLVCKVTDANGRPAVKLSDNITKATGPADEIERYRRVFGEEGIVKLPVAV